MCVHSVKIVSSRRFQRAIALNMLWSREDFIPFRNLETNPDLEFLTGLPHVREKSGKFNFFQSQGIVREFWALSGNFENSANVREMSGNFEKNDDTDKEKSTLLKILCVFTDGCFTQNSSETKSS